MATADQSNKLFSRECPGAVGALPLNAARRPAAMSGEPKHACRESKGCNEHASRVPFSSWLPAVAAGLKGELLPLFQELGVKLDNHMEKVEEILMQRHVKHTGCINTEQRTGHPCGSAEAAIHDACSPILTPLPQWEEPDNQVQPQPPGTLAGASLTPESMKVFRQSALQGHLHTFEAPSTSQPQISGCSLAGAQSTTKSHTIFRKSMEKQWMGHMISEASLALGQMKESLSIRSRVASMFGIKDANLSSADDGFLSCIVHSVFFTSVCTMLVVVDFLHMSKVSHEIMLDSLNASGSRDHGATDYHIEMTFAIIFLLEICMRICAERWCFFFGKHWKSNTAEALLVSVTFILTLADGKKEYMRLIRALRMFQIVRIISRSGTLVSLRFMISSMLNCLPTLLWAGIIITVLLSFFSVMIIKVSSSWLRNFADPQNLTHQDVIMRLDKYFRGFFATIRSLFMAVTGGMDWVDLWDTCNLVDPFLGFCFLLYIFFMILGIFNVLVGICVDRAFAASRHNQDFVTYAQKQEEKCLMRVVHDMFVGMDTEGTGFITQAQFLACQEDPRMLSFLRAHQLDMIQPTWLFSMLDKDGSNTMSLSELTVGLLRMSGQARSSDVILLFTLTMELREDIVRLKKSLPAARPGTRDRLSA